MPTLLFIHDRLCEFVQTFRASRITCKLGTMPRWNFGTRTIPMGKEKNKGNKETKKPKKEVVKVLATANAGLSKDGTTIAGKKVK
jgi:hypothetical protein